MAQYSALTTPPNLKVNLIVCATDVAQAEKLVWAYNSRCHYEYVQTHFHVEYLGGTEDAATLGVLQASSPEEAVNIDFSDQITGVNNIYKLSPSEKLPPEAYTVMYVCASSPEAAREYHPLLKPEWDLECWASSPDKVTVQYLGQAVADLTPGILLRSNFEEPNLEPLKIYKVTPARYIGRRRVYTVMIVCAESEEQARNTHPASKIDDPWETSKAWVNDPKDVNVTLVKTSLETPIGVVSSHYLR